MGIEGVGTPANIFRKFQVAGKLPSKELNLNSPLLTQASYRTLVMSSLPADLSTSEAEKWNIFIRPPIPFVLVHELTDAATKPKTAKLTIEGGITMTYPIWQGGTPKGLLCHIQSVLGTVNKDRDVTNRYNAAVAEWKEAQGKVQELKKLLEGYDVEEDDVAQEDLAAQIAALNKPFPERKRK